MTDVPRICGCLGCRAEATAVIDRDGDRRTVCDDHVNGYPVIDER